jgi:hypothetical protein
MNILPDTLDSIRKCTSKSQVAKLLGLPVNGTGFRTINGLMKKYSLVLAKRVVKPKYETIEKLCPGCGKTFKALKGHPKEKQTCGYGCSNTVFRSGPNNGNWSEAAYASTCFHAWGKKCCVCDEHLIVEAHHFDGNHSNNAVENLVPLCSTHHRYLHSSFAHHILDIVKMYVKTRKMSPGTA